MKNITHLSLFSGIGGLDLAAEWAGFKTVGQCEWADYPTKVLEKHWPDVPRWKDIRTLTGESFYERTGLRTVDVISGGFPCQPFSVAGKQRGKEDDRYLWPEMARVIKELRPTWVIGENVAGIIRMALSDILSDLEACGYGTRTFLIPACAIGARHRRYRVAIVGHAKHDGLSATEKSESTGEAGERCEEREETASKFKGTGEPGNSENVGRTKIMADTNDRQCSRTDEKICTRGTIPFACRETMADAQGIGLQGKRTAGQQERAARPTARKSERGSNVRNSASPGLPDGAGEQMGGQGTSDPELERPVRRSVESVLGGVVDGIPDWMDGNLDFLINHYWDEEPDIPRIARGIKNRVDRLKSLGNAVVPQQFYPIFKAIANIEMKEEKE